MLVSNIYIYIYINGLKMLFILTLYLELISLNVLLSSKSLLKFHRYFYVHNHVSANKKFHSNTQKMHI